ncbi:homocysteine S-methyltransferase family protein, partial [Nocardiopsis tropica]|nr:homocysteine S-methyltransferase family protein [Nocardiopsis tropica]
EAGAVLVGGCCRTGPEHVRSVRARLDAHLGRGAGRRP